MISNLVQGWPEVWVAQRPPRRQTEAPLTNFEQEERERKEKQETQERSETATSKIITRTMRTLPWTFLSGRNWLSNKVASSRSLLFRVRILLGPVSTPRTWWSKASSACLAWPVPSVFSTTVITRMKTLQVSPSLVSPGGAGGCLMFQMMTFVPVITLTATWVSGG